jgi:hypothetical protein
MRCRRLRLALFSLLGCFDLGGMIVLHNVYHT